MLSRSLRVCRAESDSSPALHRLPCTPQQCPAPQQLSAPSLRWEQGGVPGLSASMSLMDLVNELGAETVVGALPEDERRSPPLAALVVRIAAAALG